MDGIVYPIPEPGDPGGSLPQGELNVQELLLENYLLLNASLEQQNLVKFDSQLQYQERVHANLLRLAESLESCLPGALLDAPLAETMEAELAAVRVMAAAQQKEAERTAELGAWATVAAAGQRAAEVLAQKEVGAVAGARAAGQAPPAPGADLAPQQQQQQGGGKKRPRRPASGGGGAGRGGDWRSDLNKPVSELLDSLGLSQYLEVLETNGVDMAALRLLREQHLLGLGLPIGAVVKIQAALEGG